MIEFAKLGFFEIKNPKIRYNPTKDPIQKLWPYIPKKIMDSFF